MFRSEPMQKVRIVCLDKDRQRIVAALHTAGILDLRKSKLELADDSAAELFTELSDTEIRLAGAIRLLKKPKNERKSEGTSLKSTLMRTGYMAGIAALKCHRQDLRA